MLLLKWASHLVLFPFFISVYAVELLPLNIGQYEAATGIKRRSLDHMSDMYPQFQTQVLYAHATDHEIHLGNITLKAPTGLPIVLSERFEPLTEYIRCDRYAGQISLTFKTANALERVLMAWRFVDYGKDERFLVVTNHDGCGSKFGRHPYM